MQEAELKYFCYICQKHFSTSFQKFSCIMCDSDAIQLIQENQKNNLPSQFSIYEIKNIQGNNKSLGTLDNGIVPRGPSISRTVVSIVSTTTHTLSDFEEGSYLGNLLRQLLRDGDRLTAATQQQIERLQKIAKLKQCSICQSLQEQQMQQENQENSQQISEGFKLSCNHSFHVQCIKPWFQRANTCPVCRKPIHHP